jgi:hypothetical protein
LLLGGKDGELFGGLELLDEVFDAALEGGHLLGRHEARQHGVAVLVELLLQLLKLLLVLIGFSIHSRINE